MPNQTDAATSIYNQAIKGSPNNPGLPPQLAQLLVGQSGNETGGWTSHFFTEGNACFGYSCSEVSEYQTSCSAGNADNGVQIGYYDSIEDSTNEIIDWIYRRVADGSFPKDLTSILSADQYATLLKNAGNPSGSKSYYGASETTYADNIKEWITNLGSFFQTRSNLPRVRLSARH